MSEASEPKPVMEPGASKVMGWMLTTIGTVLGVPSFLWIAYWTQGIWTGHDTGTAREGNGWGILFALPGAVILIPSLIVVVAGLLVLRAGRRPKRP